MAITFVGAGTAAFGNNADVTPTLHANTAAGDLIVVLTVLRGENATAGAMTLNAVGSGYTELFNFTHSTGSPRPRLAGHWKIAGAGEADPLVDIAPLATGATVGAQCATFRGINTADPIDAIGGNDENASQQDIGPIIGFTPAANDGAIIVVGGKCDDWTSVDLLTGDGLTWVEIGEPDSILGQDEGLVWDHAIWVGAPPTITNKTFTVTGGAANKGLGTMFSLNPATLAGDEDGYIPRIPNAMLSTLLLTVGLGIQATGAPLQAESDPWMPPPVALRVSPHGAFQADDEWIEQPTVLTADEADPSVWVPPPARAPPVYAWNDEEWVPLAEFVADEADFWPWRPSAQLGARPALSADEELVLEVQILEDDGPPLAIHWAPAGMRLPPVDEEWVAPPLVAIDDADPPLWVPAMPLGIVIRLSTGLWGPIELAAAPPLVGDDEPDWRPLFWRPTKTLTNWSQPRARPLIAGWLPDELTQGLAMDAGDGWERPRFVLPWRPPLSASLADDVLIAAAPPLLVEDEFASPALWQRTAAGIWIARPVLDEEPWPQAPAIALDEPHTWPLPVPWAQLVTRAAFGVEEELGEQPPTGLDEASEWAPIVRVPMLTVPMVRWDDDRFSVEGLVLAEDSDPWLPVILRRSVGDAYPPLPVWAPGDAEWVPFVAGVPIVVWTRMSSLLRYLAKDRAGSRLQVLDRSHSRFDPSDQGGP
jgi:hypothetical protein